MEFDVEADENDMISKSMAVAVNHAVKDMLIKDPSIIYAQTSPKTDSTKTSNDKAAKKAAKQNLQTEITEPSPEPPATQNDALPAAKGAHDNQLIDISCYDTFQTNAVMIELSRGQEATILIRKPNIGVNMGS